MSDATDVLHAIDQLRRDLSGYHGHLVAHNDLQRHRDNQRKRIGELEAIHARDKSENAKLRDLAHRMARALRVGSGWCDVDCARAFKCSDLVECPIEVAMSELGIEVD